MARYKELQDFYASDEWRTLRFNLILKRGNKCNRCGKVLDSSKLIGHHITELTLDNVDDYNISLNEDNIELICLDCHNIEHHRFCTNNSQQVFIVYGSPCSGKNAYVNQVYKYNDVVIDIDKIWKCLTNENIYIKPTSISPLVFSVYNNLIDDIKVRKGNWNNCYLIGGFANKAKRERLRKELNANLIYIKSTKEECLKRLKNDEERSGVVQQWKKYIEEWWEEYIE